MKLLRPGTIVSSEAYSNRLFKVMGPGDFYSDHLCLDIDNPEYGHYSLFESEITVVSEPRVPTRKRKQVSLDLRIHYKNTNTLT